MKSLDRTLALCSRQWIYAHLFAYPNRTIVMQKLWASDTVAEMASEVASNKDLLASLQRLGKDARTDIDKNQATGKELAKKAEQFSAVLSPHPPPQIGGPGTNF